MTRKELEKVKKVLEHIGDRDAYVEEVLSYVKRDIALREQQRVAMKENFRYDPDFPG